MKKYFIQALVAVCCIWAVDAYAKIMIEPPPDVPPGINSRDFKELTAARETLLNQFNETQQKIDKQAENCRNVEEGSDKEAECVAEAQEVKAAVREYRIALKTFKSRLAELLKGSNTSDTFKVESDLKDALNDAGTALLLRKPSELENQKGGRYIDCDATRQFYDRASASLSSQKEAIKRTEVQKDDAKKATQEDYEKLEHLLRKSVLDTTRNTLSGSEMVQKRINAIMKKTGLSPKQRKTLQDVTKLLKEAHDKIKKDKETFETEVKYAEKIKQAKGYKESFLVVHKLLDDSGIYDEAVKEFSKATLGPEMGQLIFDASKLTVDTTLLEYKKYIDEGDLVNAQMTYDSLKYELSQMQEKLDNAQSDLTKYCSNGQSIVVAP